MLPCDGSNAEWSGTCIQGTVSIPFHICECGIWRVRFLFTIAFLTNATNKVQRLRRTSKLVKFSLWKKQIWLIDSTIYILGWYPSIAPIISLLKPSPFDSIDPIHFAQRSYICLYMGMVFRPIPFPPPLLNSLSLFNRQLCMQPRYLCSLGLRNIFFNTGKSRLQSCLLVYLAEEGGRE